MTKKQLNVLNESIIYIYFKQGVLTNLGIQTNFLHAKYAIPWIMLLQNVQELETLNPNVVNVVFSIPNFGQP